MSTTTEARVLTPDEVAAATAYPNRTLGSLAALCASHETLRAENEEMRRLLRVAMGGERWDCRWCGFNHPIGPCKDWQRAEELTR